MTYSQFSQNFIYVVNVFTLLIGCAMLGFSIYLWSQIDQGWGTYVPLNYIGIGIAAGILMIGISFLGCVAARNHWKRIMLCYLIFVVGIFALEVAMAVFAYQYWGFVGDQNLHISSDYITRASVDINNGVLSTYTDCCRGCPIEDGCNNDAGQPYANITMPPCTDQGFNCSAVTKCSAAANVTDACYVYLVGDADLVPPYRIANSFCGFLTGAIVNGSALVGNVSTGGCGGGVPEVFRQNINTYFSSRLYWVAIGFIVIAVIQALLIVASAYIVFCEKNHPPAKQ